MGFQDDLRRYGPGSTARTTREEALAYCAHLTASHYENFSVVTWLTPREHRPAFQSIYAYCRWADDLGDEIGDPARSLELLEWWRRSLREMYEGDTTHPVMIALHDTVSRSGIPIEPFEALIDAFVQDQTVTEYETFAQLTDYCTRSANPVGHLVLHVAGAFSQENARLSDATCTALQLANFWQDVARDLAIGRIYLPREDREHFGYPDDDLKSLRHTPAFRDLMKFQVDRTRAMFREGQPLASRVGGPIAVDLDLFSRGGLAILAAIEKRDFNVLDRRPSLSKWTKAALLGKALFEIARSRLRRNPTCESSWTAPAARRNDAAASLESRGVNNKPPLDDSYQFCDQIARREARNFYLAFLMLPGRQRRSMNALYGFMRHTDDLADQTGDPREKLAALERWRVELDNTLDGKAASWPGLPAFADTVERYQIPRRHLHAVIDGVAMDQTDRVYATYEDLEDYCYHVASVVGLCCLQIWGYDSDGGRAEELAETCGIALQLTNILRDIAEDARQGRIYLPRDEMAQFGVEPDDLIRDRPTSSVKELMAFQARRAHESYDRSRDLVALVDPVGRPVLLTIMGIYRALLDEIVRRDYNVFAGRVSVPTWRKAAIALKAIPSRVLGSHTRRTPTLVP